MKELLFSLTRKDFVVEAKRGSGKGGQNRNVTNSACRITHPPSGATGQAQDERDYHQNEKLAFRRLVNSIKFQVWHKMECSRRLGHLKDIEQTVERAMQHVKVESQVDGKWTEIP